MDRRDEALKLRESGLSYTEIGKRLGVSRERVRQILKGGKSLREPKQAQKPMLTTRGVAQLIGVHINTVRRWSRQGILKAYRISPRGDRRYRREDIDSFLAERPD